MNKTEQQAEERLPSCGRYFEVLTMKKHVFEGLNRLIFDFEALKT
jgi:hypothetical protein